MLKLLNNFIIKLMIKKELLVDSRRFFFRKSGILAYFSKYRF